MKDYFIFFKNNAAEIRFAWTLTFLSSFGQTFLISLYVPELLKQFEISEGFFGGIYAIATVVASILLIMIGHTVDHKPIRKVTFYTILALALSTILLAFSTYHLILLFIALIGLRLNGQALLSHISQTILSKRFHLDRGKALSIASSGFPIGEAIFPVILTSLLLWKGLRINALISAAFLGIYLIRLLFFKVKSFDENLDTSKKGSGKLLYGEFKGLLKEKKFWIIVAASMSLSFVTTAFFFYQYVFAENLNWSVTLYAIFFTVYAICRFVMAFVGGLLVDKYSARKVFRFYLAPIIIGLIPMIFTDHIFAALFFLAMAGISQGTAGTVKTAVVAETYGTKKLGTIRSFFNMFMIFSTALGPLVIGIMMDNSVSFSLLMLTLTGLLFIAFMNSQRLSQVNSKTYAKKA